MEYRVGIGYDIHRLVAGRRLVLGGVEIAHSKGLLGHSDADVVLHAICDALLGALGSGDIGEHFPNTDNRYKDIASIELLKKVYGLVKEKGYSVVNIDTAIIAEEPAITPFKSAMRKVIAQAVGLREEDVNIKATTREGIALADGSEAIAAYATALLIK